MTQHRWLPIVAAGAGVLLTVPGAPAFAASPAGNWAATASATGVEVIASNQSIPLGISPQAHAPTASAAHDSLGESDARAALPDPGSETRGLPGVIAAGTNAPLPPLPYPLEVATAYGDQPRTLSWPGLSLSARSEQSATSASAAAGPPGAGDTAESSVQVEGDTVVTTARSHTDEVRLAGLVIRGLDSSASVVRESTGALTRSASLRFSALSAPGMVLNVPSQGEVISPALSFDNGRFALLMPGDGPEPIPVPAGEVFAALAAIGISGTYQQARTTAGGVEAPLLTLAMTLPAPPPGLPGGFSGPTPVMVRVGSARAEVSGSELSATAQSDP